jgi:hypothetical protein
VTQRYASALVTYLHACQMVSYGRMTEVLDGLFGLKLSEGAIPNMLARAAKPFAACAASIAETVRQSSVVASDETSARVCGKTHWQWTFAAASAVYHTIAPTRGAADAGNYRQDPARRGSRRRTTVGRRWPATAGFSAIFLRRFSAIH